MSPEQIKVSFDVDGTIIDNKQIQDYAKELIARDIEVWICTRRYSNIDNYTKEFCNQYGITNLIHEHKRLFTVAKECGIKPERIHFMDMIDKFHFFNQNEGFLWHLDDDYWEIMDINKWSKTVGISCANGANWRGKCERLIKKKLNGKL